MSYDLGAWYDPKRRVDPRGRWDALADAPAGTPDKHVAAFVADLERHWPWTDEDDDSSPWATWPLSSQAGPLGVALNVRYSHTNDVARIGALAHRHGLTVYDPQQDRAFPPPARPLVRPWLVVTLLVLIALSQVLIRR